MRGVEPRLPPYQKGVIDRYTTFQRNREESNLRISGFNRALYRLSYSSISGRLGSRTLKGLFILVCFQDKCRQPVIGLAFHLFCSSSTSE